MASNYVELFVRRIQHGSGRPIHNDKLPVGLAFDGRSIQPDLTAAPPETFLAFVLPVGKPVLPQNHANLPRRFSRKWIGGEKSQYVRLSKEKTLLNLDNKSVFTPGAQRSEPEIPVETRLVGREDSRRRVQILWLITKGVGGPGLAVARTLEF